MSDFGVIEVKFYSSLRDWVCRNKLRVKFERTGVNLKFTLAIEPSNLLGRLVKFSRDYSAVLFM
ncbi:hypothetical protein CSUNSWCD_2093 [Campylobacter showae CSUNSWCD]|uniref:Uncharacterized protein n=1 Tax=Campylobacter showae CSUNSWCD TaxID=1244083 RepID=M5IG75_9BACT|nr:hypothetical protein CSUNSWCD_2093 [Campylobacter showae CSUNSWCD]